MPPKKKGPPKKGRGPVKNAVKGAKLADPGNGEPSNGGKQKKSKASKDKIVKGMESTRKRRVSSEEKISEDNLEIGTKVDRATLIEDGNEMELAVSQEQDAEFASEPEKDTTPEEVSPPRGSESETSSPQVNHEADLASTTSFEEIEDMSDGELDDHEAEDEPECNRHIKHSPVQSDHCGKKKVRKSRSPCPRCKESVAHSPRKAGRRRCCSKDKLKSAFAELKNMMTRWGYFDSDDKMLSDADVTDEEDNQRQPRGNKHARRSEHGNNYDLSIEKSDTTIYKPAIKPARGSSSSEGIIDISNETIELNLSGMGVIEGNDDPDITFKRQTPVHNLYVL